MPRKLVLEHAQIIQLVGEAGCKLLRQKHYQELAAYLGIGRNDVATREIMIRHLKILGLYKYTDDELEEEIDNDIDHTPAGKPRRPTMFEPGSPEKLEVLADRCAKGQALHHPDDCKREFVPPPQLSRMLQPVSLAPDND